MVFWVLAGLVLYLVQIYLSAAIYLPVEGLARHAGGRDTLPERGVYAGRAERALVNLKENMPFFLTLALLALIIEGADMGQAVLGAQIFVLSRAAYVVLYLISIPWTRSAAYTVSIVGLLMMAAAVV